MQATWFRQLGSEIHPALRNRWVPAVKRLMDLGIAGTSLMVAGPVLGVVAAVVRWKLGPPVLFRQVRPGLREAEFTIFKFRTLSNETDENGELLPDSQRITNLGALLRTTSLDELPELWNVVRGDMSLVGPRPLLPRYSKVLSEAEKQRFQVRPGITGWAQINGRNDTPWDERLARDVWYVQNQSLRLDLRILLRTGMQVMRRSGTIADPGAVMLNLDEERGNRRLE